MLEFKDKLKEFRKDRRLTQKDLAEKLGVSRSNIAEMEAGRVKGKLSILEKLSEISGYPLVHWANNSEELEFNTYDSIDVLFGALVKAGQIKEDGRIPGEFKESFMDLLEKEFALKYYKMKNKK